MEQSKSGLVRRAAPIPECVEKGFGQPQLRSIPDTSCITVFAAWTASSGSEEPIWYIRYGFSIGWVVNIALDFPLYDMTPVTAGKQNYGNAREMFKKLLTINRPFRM